MKNNFCVIFVVANALLAMFGFKLLTAHPCDRHCGSLPMECEYNFTLEWYATMSKACYDCPFVASDCERPHCVAADGFERAINSVNREVPGPAITVCHNDTVIVHVRNMLDNNEGTTIHWHGIYQTDSQWMDGVPMLTQCPIPAKTAFTYKFKAMPAGTHWWHAHAGFQRSDGIAGALVVKTSPQEDPHVGLYDVDNANYTVLVGDWLHQMTMTKYVLHHHSSGNNKGESMLINGKGESEVFVRNGTNYTTPLTTFDVERGQRYRFRIINNAALFCPMEISIDQHILTVIATDGIDVNPLNVTSVVVHGGERFDFVVTANQEISSYWFRVQGMADCRNQSQRAILRYDVTSTERPTSSSNSSSSTSSLNPLNQQESENVMFVTKLRTVLSADPKISGTPDEVYFLGFDFKKIDNPQYHDPDFYPIKVVERNNHLYTPQINNITFASHSFPPLTQQNHDTSSVECGTEAEQNLVENEFRSCPHVYNVSKGKLIELVVFDEGVTFTAGHPMHLHGQHFAVVAMDKVDTNISKEMVKNLHRSGAIQYNFDRPVMKDTVIIPDGGYAVLRFVSDNPGIWAFHCHLAFHLEAGMTMAFRVGDHSDVKGIPANFPKCGNWESPTSAASSHRWRSVFSGYRLLTVCAAMFVLLIRSATTQ